MKNYNKIKLSAWSSDSNFSLRFNNNSSNILSNKEILSMPKKNKSENNLNSMPKYIHFNNKNQPQSQNADNQNLMKGSNSGKNINKDGKSFEDIKDELNIQNKNSIIDPESKNFRNRSNNNDNIENDESIEIPDISSDIDNEIFNDKDNFLITKVLCDEKHKKMFNKNKNLKKIFYGGILKINDNIPKKKEIYIGQMKAKLSYDWK
jgi:hypothetical protein